MGLPELNTTIPLMLLVGGGAELHARLGEAAAACGCRLLVKSDAQDVSQALAADNLRAMLVDLDAAGDTLFAVLQSVRELRPELPLIVLSSRADFHLARQMLRHGVLDYLVKPVPAHELLEALRRANDLYQSGRRSASAEREAQRRLADLILLREIGETASSSGDLQVLFDKIVDSIMHSAAVEMVSLMLVDEQGQLSIAAARGLSTDIMARARVAPGEGISGHVLATGKPVLVTDLSRDPRFAGSATGGRYKTQSLVSVPIRIREQVLGVINVNNKRSGETFNAEDQHLLTAISHQVALAIENFKLVSSLRRQAHELEMANANLVKLSKARSHLVCNLSHELKTPLTSILGFVDLILNFFEHVDQEELRDYLRKVHDESLRMDRMISGMLRLFTIDSGNERWDWRRFSLEAVTSEAISRKRREIAHKGLHLVVGIAPELPDIYGDPEKAALLVNALMDNAVKFNRTGGRILVSLESRGSGESAQVYLQIRNDGQTVPSESGDDIFDQYTQLGNINTEKPAGVGIGLALAKAIISRMGGSIFLEKTDGEGTTFGVLFPTLEKKREQLP